MKERYPNSKAFTCSGNIILGFLNNAGFPDAENAATEVAV
jgi:hypothetical protein